MEITLNSIDSAAKEYAEARTRLGDLVLTLTDEIEAAKRRLMHHIKKAVAHAAEKQSALRGLVWSSPQLFDKPKTVVFHGIKVGYRKGTGAIVYDDADTVIALIEKHLDDQAEILIKTKKSLRAKALEALDVADLKRIGCQVEATGDVVVCKPVDSDVDKVVKALLKDAQEDEAE